MSGGKLVFSLININSKFMKKVLFYLSVFMIAFVVISFYGSDAMATGSVVSPGHEVGQPEWMTRLENWIKSWF